MMFDHMDESLHLAWEAHREAHPERNRVTGSWRRMANRADVSYHRVGGRYRLHARSAATRFRNNYAHAPYGGRG